MITQFYDVPPGPRPTMTCYNDNIDSLRIAIPQIQINVILYLVCITYLEQKFNFYARMRHDQHEVERFAPPLEPNLGELLLDPTIPHREGKYAVKESQPRSSPRSIV